MKPLDRTLTDLAIILSRRNMPCRLAIPTRRGDLLLGFGERPVCFLVTAQPRTGLKSFSFGDLYIAVRDEEGSDMAASVIRTLSEVRATPTGSFLDLHNRECTEVEHSVEGFMRLMAWQLSIGTNYWRNWRVSEVTAVRDGFRILLASGDGHTAQLGFEASARPHVIRVTPLGVLFEVEKSDDTASDAIGAFAFIMSLSLHKDMKWRAIPEPLPVQIQETPPPPTEEPLNEVKPLAPPLRESLTINCFTSGRPWDYPRSRFFDIWGDRDYFILTSLFGGARRFLFHGNRECQQVKQPLSSRISHGVTPYSELPRSRLLGSRNMSFTDTDDMTAVFGGMERLERVLRDTCSKNPDRTVHVMVGCDSFVVGDDVIGVCNLLNKEGACLYVLNPPIPRFTDGIGRNWWAHFLSLRRRDVPRKSRTVNLAGIDWPSQPVVRELEQLLERNGIKVATVFFPGVGPGFFERLEEAVVTVASPWLPVEKVLLAPMADEGLRSITPQAPYGFDGTRRWIDAIRTELGLPVIDEGEWRALLREAVPDLDALRQSASGVTVALIADRGSLVELRSPQFFFGFDPVDLLVDLGFRVVLFGYSAATAAEMPLYDEGARARVVFVEMDPDRDPLPCLADYGVRLLYCDRVDRPGYVAKQGVATFSIRDLEPGLAGGGRSLSRLLAKARMRLYSDYSTYLKGSDAKS